MIKKIVLLAVLGMATLASCAKKESSTSGEFPQELLIDNERYELAALLAYNYGPNPNLYQGTNFNLSFLSEGIKVHADSAQVRDSLSGNGFVLRLDVYSPDSLNLSEGNYVLDSSQTNYSLAQAYLLSYKSSDTLSQVLRVGSLEVIRLGEIYTILGDFKSLDGREVVFSFQSELKALRRF